MACSCERSMYRGIFDSIFFLLVETGAYHIKSYRIVLTCATLMTRVTMKASPSVNSQTPRMKKAASKGAVISAQPVSISLWNYYSPVLRSRQVACTHHTKHFWFTSLTHNTNTTTCQCNFVWNVCVSARRIEFWMNGMKIYWNLKFRRVASDAHRTLSLNWCE